MRDIKFRGKRIDNGEWVCGNVIVTSDGHCLIQPWIKTTGIGYTHPNAGEVDPETVGQYTGLKDRNGKEIYEGDIIRCPKYYETPENGYNPDEIAGAVVFEEGKWTLSEGGYLNEEHDSYDGKLEIIGNIHSNTELLTGGRDDD